MLDHLGVPSDEGSLRLEAEPQSVQDNPRKVGPLAVDLFTSRLTHQLDRFFSWRLDPEAEAWNTFTQDWRKIQGRLRYQGKSVIEHMPDANTWPFNL